jgi:glycosyltransferase involved in cell wall biosynthesis
MTNVLLYTDDADAGGVAQYNHALVCELAKHHYRITCVHKVSRSPLVAIRVRLGIRHQWLPFDPVADFGRSLSDVSYPANLFQQLGPDLILFSNGCPVSNFAAKEAAVRLGVPFVVIENSSADYLVARFAKYAPDLASHYANARAVIAVSKQTLQMLRRHFGLPAAVGEVIYGGRPAHFFEPPDPAVRARLRAELNIGDEDVLCLTTARLDPVKGHAFLVGALMRLRQSPQWRRLHFVWIGGGPLQARLAATLEEAHLTERVHLLGQRRDVADWLGAADMFALTSLTEGMPLTVMEAMAKGLPVMATAVSGIPEELSPTGRLLPDPNRQPEACVQELVATISSWASNADLRREVGAACRERALVLFQEERMLDQTRAVIEQVLGAPSQIGRVPATPRETRILVK